MRRVTVSLADDLEAAALRFQQDQTVPPTLNAMVQVALREFLAKRGYLPSGKQFYIASAEQGSGFTDTSINHDRIEMLAEVSGT